MNNILYWFQRNREPITWFIIGFMTAQGIEQLQRGDYTGASLSFAIAGLNYYTR